MEANVSDIKTNSQVPSLPSSLSGLPSFVLENLFQTDSHLHQDHSLLILDLTPWHLLTDLGTLLTPFLIFPIPAVL